MKSLAAVSFVTTLLVLNWLLASLGVAAWWVVGVSFAGPVLVTWMVVSVLREPWRARELGEQDWGYADRPDVRPEPRLE